MDRIRKKPNANPMMTSDVVGDDSKKDQVLSKSRKFPG